MIKTIGERLLNFFNYKDAGSALPDDELKVAAAALLVHAAAVDGRISESETELLRTLLQDHFHLTPEEAHELLIAAEQSERKAIDLYHFTSKVKQHMTEAERQDIVYMMWQIAFADGKLDALEDNLLWRAAELLGVSARDRMLMKKRAAVRT